MVPIQNVFANEKEQLFMEKYFIETILPSDMILD